VETPSVLSPKLQQEVAPPEKKRLVQIEKLRKDNRPIKKMSKCDVGKQCGQCSKRHQDMENDVGSAPPLAATSKSLSVAHLYIESIEPVESVDF
jgi:hypothetical protein